MQFVHGSPESQLPFSVIMVTARHLQRQRATRSSPEFFRVDIYNTGEQIVFRVPLMPQHALCTFFLTYDIGTCVCCARTVKCSGGYNRIIWCFCLKGNVRLDFVLSERCCPRRVLPDCCIHLVAYIGADECKCCGGVDRARSQHKDKLAVSNCCTVMNADPPCTERYLHRWIPFSPCSQIPAEIGVSVIMCIKFVMFH